MKNCLLSLALVLASAGWLNPASAHDSLIIKRNAAHQFVTLPDGVKHPEGIAANPDADEIIVGTFNFAGNNKLLRYRKNGHLLAIRNFDAPLLGLAYHAPSNKIYIAYPAALAGAGPSRVLRIAANFGPGTPIEEVANIKIVGAPGFIEIDNPDGSKDKITFGNNAPAPNALVFNDTGDLYVSDSFQGAVFKINNAPGCGGGGPACVVDTVVHDGRLATAGFPPFGANGVALRGSFLYVANTGDDRILRFNLTTKELSVFAESLNGADGIVFDDKGRLWVATNQADEVVALNEKGRIVAKLGEFQGIRHDGTPRGLLFPASLAILDGHLYVTNLALELRTDVVGDEPEEDVTAWTVSRMEIP